MVLADKSDDSISEKVDIANYNACLLYTSDAADERSSVDLGGRRIIKKKTTSDKRNRRLHKKNNTKTQYRTKRYTNYTTTK